eukprot:Anaeramoba_ignava/a347512_181.p1 GENE.a347512_181~~a347512_181.p1  ORF type:complete len:814 (-),score=231.02 a347512_181:166-2607(-)
MQENSKPKTKTPQEELSLVVEAEKETEQLIVGETWYLLDYKWWIKWQKYVKYHTDETDDNPQPDAIDNSSLLTEDLQELKPELVENQDYTLVSEKVWEVLVSIYSGGPAIPRKVIEISLSKTTKVEVYPMRLSFILNSETKIFEFSCISKISDVADQVSKEFKLPKENYILCIITADYFKILKPEKTIETSKLTQGDKIYIFLKDKFDSLNQNKQNLKINIQDGGLVGLSNLGNTCFMNSGLQCLFHSMPLVHYFLTDEYKNHINKTNPIGMKGKLAKQFGALAKAIWSSSPFGSLSPRNLKFVIGQFASQFMGYGQQDSQELIGFLLDGLHEDLNKIIKKPLPQEVKTENKSDEELSRDFWSAHVARNDSVIVDIFQGQVKSRLHCPKCSKISITFDPVMYYSLPLPQINELRIPVTVVPLENPPTTYLIHAESPAHVNNVLEGISKCTKIPTDNLVLSEIFQKKIYKNFSPSEKFNPSPRDVFFSYEVSPVNQETENKRKRSLVSVLQYQFVQSKNQQKMSLSRIGNPLIIDFGGPEITLEKLREKIAQRFTHITSKLPDWETIKQNAKENKFENIYSNWEFKNDPKNHFFCVFQIGYTSDLEKKFAGNETIPFPQRSTIGIVWDPMLTSQELINDEILLQTIKHESFVQYTKKKKADATLFECVEQYITEEQLSSTDKWYCPHCKEFVQAYKKMDFWKMPNILIIQLKRFSYTRYYRSKIDKFIEFPEILDLSPYISVQQETPPVYRLIAVSNHYGGYGGGHYTAYCFHEPSKKWYSFNDSSVSKISSFEETLSSAAYVLFYQKISPKQK